MAISKTAPVLAAGAVAKNRIGPSAPGEYAIIVTARETPHDEQDFRQESIEQLFIIYVLHDEARSVPISELSKMTGSPIHKDVFDITKDNTRPETIFEFIKGQDKIFINKIDVYIQRIGDTTGYNLYSDAEKSERLAIVYSLSGALTPDDFDAHSLDASLADIVVTVHDLM